MDYQETVNFWQTVCQQVLIKGAVTEVWEPWLEIYFNDGAPIQDGNPIFMAINQAQNRAVRIIQNSFDESSIDEWTAWMDKTEYELNKGSELVDEMVFVYNSDGINISEISVQVFTELFEKWSNQHASYEAMEKIITSRIGN